MFNKKIDTNADIHELIASRWSGRAYDKNRALTHQDIISLVEAARWAPSCFGDQPWRFIVFDKATDLSAWSNAIDCLAEGNRAWAINAPVLLLVSANSIMTRNGNPNRWGEYDTGAAAENLCLQAAALGLMAHQMGGFDSKKAKGLFNIPEQFTPMAMITVGYQLPEADMTEDIKEREYNERVRNPLSDNFFSSSWGEPINIKLK